MSVACAARGDHPSPPTMLQAASEAKRPVCIGARPPLGPAQRKFSTPADRSDGTHESLHTVNTSVRWMYYLGGVRLPPTPSRPQIDLPRGPGDRPAAGQSDDERVNLTHCN